MELTNYNEIQELLHRHGFRFSKSMGQNFLVEAWVPRRIAEESGITSEDGVLEIGPGIGCLTVELAQRAAVVNSLELDHSLAPILQETLAPYSNASVTFADAVKTDLRSHCALHLGERQWKVCANLPYNVTSPLITAFLEAQCFDSVTVMIQREVAQRICARPGTAEYGAFTVLVNWYAQAQKLFDVPPHCFLPQPKVTSSVIHLVMRKEKPAVVADEKFFFRVVRAAFNQRRKTLPNALSAGIDSVDRIMAEECMRDLGIDPRTRGEVLDIAAFSALSNALLARIHNNL